MNIDTGRYVAQAVQGQIYEGDDNKAPTVGVELRVLEGPDKGRAIFWYGGLKEGKNQEITAQCLRNMGWRCNDITELKGLGSTRVILAGKRDEYTDKKTGALKVGQGWNVYPVKTPQPTLEADKKASFANRFKALAASVAPVAVTSHNAGVDVLPEKIESGNGRATTGPAAAASGVPF